MQHSAYKCYRQHSAYNNMVLCTKTFVKRAILMLRILTTKKEKKKKEKRNTRKLSEVMDMFIAFIVVIVSWYMHTSKLIKLYTLNV